MERDNKYTNKKRKNNKEDSKMEVEEDTNFYYDQNNIKITNKDEIEDLNQIIDVDFLFSEIRNTYFFGIKNFLEGLLDFEEFDASGLSDLIVEEGDYLGTTIKTELEEETGNNLPDLYALVTLIPYNSFFASKSINQIMQFCIKKSENEPKMKQFLEGMVAKHNQEYFKNLSLNNVDLSKYKLGIFINERASNLPMPLVGPLLNLLQDDIIKYKEVNDGADKYDFTHILYITK
jgi:hypothetical protein